MLGGKSLSLNTSVVSTTAELTLLSYLGVEELLSILSGEKITKELVLAGYNVIANNPDVTNLVQSPTLIPVYQVTSTTTNTRSSDGINAAISLGVLVFVALVVGLVYYYKYVKQVRIF